MTLMTFPKKLCRLFRRFRGQTGYLKYYRTLPLKEKTVLVDSQHGEELRGNMFYLLRELCQNPEYADYRIYVTVVASKRKSFQQLMEANAIQGATLLVLGTKAYYKVAASAKYLFNDTSFLPFFIKKEGQVYLNTWHGTPLKTLGRRVAQEPHSIGNVQRNLLMADYLLFPNRFTKERLQEDYMLADIGEATLLMGGYPRNAAFFNTERATTIRTRQKLDGKKVYAYMPTWRGVVGNADSKADAFLQTTLMTLDGMLRDEEVLFVNLHPLARKSVEFQEFKHIHAFPQEYETYEFLNTADALVTDYSSVFFDFALTRKKTVLYTYDEEEYLADRGLYMPLSDLPFPQVKTPEELMAVLRAEKAYDDEAFVSTFCPYDSPDAARLLCERVILGRQNGLKEDRFPHNGKKNILLYVGNLAKNGITASMQNLLSHVDRSQYNYYITFDAQNVAAYRDVLFHLPEGVRYLSCMGNMNMSFGQTLMFVLYHCRCVPFKWFWKTTQSVFIYELRRRYGEIPFSTVIQFNGYEYEKILMFSQVAGYKAIYVHSDMVNEINTRGYQRREVLNYAYTHYDKLAIVSEDIMEPTREFTIGRDDHFCLARNIVNYRDIQTKATQPFVLDADTLVTPCDKEQLQEILENDGRKFVTIGRFSPEKGHLRLLDAFSRVWEEHPDTYLVILGGHGDLYEKTVAKAAALPCRDHVLIIQSMSNPYIVLTRCDYFVLSSLYEGFGIVIAEADILGKPVVSPDINGPRGFMQKNGGTLVENSTEGLYRGMKAQLEGRVPVMGVDFEAYNREAIHEFYGLLQ